MQQGTSKKQVFSGSTVYHLLSVFFMCLGLAGIILMVLIGILQTVGIMITAISAVVLKSISTVMLFATVLLLVFGRRLCVPVAVSFQRHGAGSG